MARRRSALRVTALPVIAALALAGCVETTGSPSTVSSTGTGAPAGLTQTEEQLRQQAAAMQRTVLEGAATGAAIGGGIGLGFGSTRTALLTAIVAGGAAGAAAGTYVGFLQQKFTREEQRLEQVKSDLDRNAAEMQTTIAVMREVLASQRQELANVRAQARTGAASQAQLSAEVTRANANLQQMQIAIDGATRRQGEFGQARGLTIVSGTAASPIDNDLAQLSTQIASMKVIANDLASSI